MILDISLVIPVYNQVKELEITLAHFITLLDENKNIKTEIIIIDDGSSDNVKQILESSIKGEDRIRFISQKHQGRASARNTGVKNALGKRIVFCDADRIPDKEFIKRHACHTEEAIIIGSSYDYYSKEKGLDICLIKKHARIPIFYKKLYKLLDNPQLYWLGSLLGNASLNKNLFQYIGGYDERFQEWGLENIELGYRAFLKNIKISYDPQIKTYHKPHKTNKQCGLGMIKCADLFEQIHPEIDGRILYQFYIGELTQNTLEEKIYK